MSGSELLVRRLHGAEGVVASGSVELEQGARGALLLVEELFRLDVSPMGDTLRVVARPMAGAECALGGSGYSGGVVAASEQLDRLAELSPARFDVSLDLRRAGQEATVPVLIGVVRFAERGTVLFTGQATVTGPLAATP